MAMAQEEFVHWLYAALEEDVTLEPSGERGKAEGELCRVSGSILPWTARIEDMYLSKVEDPKTIQTCPSLTWERTT